MAEDPYKEWLKAKANYLASLENNDKKIGLYMDWLGKNPMPGTTPSKAPAPLTPDSGKISNIKKNKLRKLDKTTNKFRIIILVFFRYYNEQTA